uniref:Leukotriene A(4) hydrolase n=1 Tax=Cuerna arida TaxID=1464854 RepID=A0A1B6EZ69_9HEMI
MTSVATLSKNDPSSFSNPEEAVITALFLNLLVDFSKKILSGEAKLSVKKVQAGVDHLALDSNGLHVKRITDGATGQALDFTISEPINIFGSKLDIKLPNDKSELEIVIQYDTNPTAFALQWLSAEQTAGRKHPYLFSQCQPIHARSIVPCQDSPSVKITYKAQISAPEELTVLMSALHDGVSAASGGQRTHNFNQPVPTPVYLLALVVGDLASRQIGPRSHVWSEPQFVDKAAYEFAETEQFLQHAEALCGPYVWGVYDLLLLPPSFPFGGMENPCLTFVTPTLLAGDRSLACVVAHEISHSWTGNLVTNRNFDHFWLNEGFTMFLERKILGRMYGEPMREFAAFNGLKDLKYTVSVLGEENPLTKLVVDLSGGIGPDDAFSTCPYEKGHTFLFYLEQLVGGPAVFEPFLKAYLDNFKYRSIETRDFKTFFKSYFANNTASKSVDWDSWLFTPGMPFIIPKYNTSLADACTALANRWVQWDMTEPNPFAPTDIMEFHTLQVLEFLAQLLELESFSLDKVQALQSVYSFNASNNSEIKFRWLRLCIKVRWEEQVTPALQFVTEQGRMKFVRPIYRDLYAWEDMRQRTINNFQATKANMMAVLVHNLAKDLHLE